MTDQERDNFIAENLNNGVKLAEIQKMLEQQFNLRLTYMELRLIAADLEVNWQKQNVEKPQEKIIEEATKTPIETADISISKLIKPGTMLNGEVTFKSGNRAEWWIDPEGRPGLNPLEGYDAPDQTDIEDFMQQMQAKLASRQY